MHSYDKIDIEPVNTVSTDEVKAVLAKLEVNIPDELIEFIAQYNGSEGDIGELYFMFDSIDDLELTNDEVVKEYTPDLFLFGSDGGSEVFGFNFKTGKYLQVPAIFCDYDEVEYVSDTLDGFIKYLTEFTFDDE